MVQEAVDYLTWTYLFRRVLMNPPYYGLKTAEEGEVSKYLTDKVDEALHQLQHAGCVTVDDDGEWLWNKRGY